MLPGQLKYTNSVQSLNRPVLWGVSSSPRPDEYLVRLQTKRLVDSEAGPWIGVTANVSFGSIAVGLRPGVGVLDPAVNFSCHPGIFVNRMSRLLSRYRLTDVTDACCARVVAQRYLTSACLQFGQKDVGACAADADADHRNKTINENSS